MESTEPPHKKARQDTKGCAPITYTTVRTASLEYTCWEDRTHGVWGMSCKVYRDV
jgi:hypothetical protein